MRNAISAETVAALNAEFDARLALVADRIRAEAAAGQRTGTGGFGLQLHDDSRSATPETPRTLTDRHGNTYTGSGFWSQPFYDLIDNEALLPILEEILGDPGHGHAPPTLPAERARQIRLDHHNITYRPPARLEEKDRGGGLHGNPDAWHVTATYELSSVNPGDGGWGCSPGSHLPENYTRLKKMSKDCWGVGGWTDSPWTERHAAWDESVPIDLVTLQTGDCLLFSEK